MTTYLALLKLLFETKSWHSVGFGGSNTSVSVEDRISILIFNNARLGNMQVISCMGNFLKS